jgi:hypothetical protein
MGRKFSGEFPARFAPRIIAKEIALETANAWTL